MIFVLLSMNGIGVVCDGVAASGLYRWGGRVYVSCLEGACGCYLFSFVMIMVAFVVMFFAGHVANGEWLYLWKLYSCWK